MKLIPAVLLVLAVILPQTALALTLQSDGEQGYFMSQALAKGITAQAWGYVTEGSIEANPVASASTDFVEASTNGEITTNEGKAELGSLATVTPDVEGTGAIAIASIDGSGTIGMDYLGSAGPSSLHASAGSGRAEASADVGLTLGAGTASIDSMAKDTSGNYARVVASAKPSDWLAAFQTVNLDLDSASATMDFFGTNSPVSAEVPERYVLGYAESGNLLGKTDVQYATDIGELHTEGITGDKVAGYVVPKVPSSNSITANADALSSSINSAEAGAVVVSSESQVEVLAHAIGGDSGDTQWTYKLWHASGEITGTATQNGVSRSVRIY